MPASRRARAMIFAPRSCPSRPGLATTTRILRRDSGCSAAVSVVACMDRELLARGPREGRRPVERAGFYKYLACFGRRARCELALGEPPAQDLLVELAHARLGNGVDEDELIRDPPLRDLSLQVPAQV